MELTQIQYETLRANGLSAKGIRLEGFAGACFDMNTVEDLIDFQVAEADKTDMKNWGISEEKWRGAQREALECAMFWFEYDLPANNAEMLG